jgi:hypothetical protein
MLAFVAAAGLAYNLPHVVSRPAAGHSRVAALRMDGEVDMDFGLALGQKYGPTAPAHPAEK